MAAELFTRAFHLAHFIFPEGGTCLEFGVYQGSSYMWQVKQMRERYLKSTLIGFDSWKGLPKESPGIWVPERHRSGSYTSPKSVVLQKLDGMDRTRFTLVDGLFSESLTPRLQKSIHNVIFINIDVDLYKSTITLLNFIQPLLQPGTILYWDDWRDPRDEHPGMWGEELAWNNWIVHNRRVFAETIEVNPNNKRSMIITSVGTECLSTSMVDVRQHATDLASEGKVPQ